MIKIYKLNVLRTIAIMVTMTLILASCEYDFIEVAPIDPNVEVLFSTDIVTIFSGNNCTNCHKTGGTSPDLTAANAYNAIYPALVNLATPEESRIYSVPASSSNHPAKYTPNQQEMVLEWIKQGAKNN